MDNFKSDYTSKQPRLSQRKATVLSRTKKSTLYFDPLRTQFFALANSITYPVKVQVLISSVGTFKSGKIMIIGLSNLKKR